MNTKHVLILGGLALLAVLALAPNASAQIEGKYSCSTSGTPPAFIMPITQRVSIQVDCDVDFKEGAVQPTQTVSMDVQASATQGSSWLTVTPSKTTVFFSVPSDQNAQGGQVDDSATFNVFLVAGDSASAYDVAQVDISLGNAQTGSASTVTMQGSGEAFNIQADFYSITSFRGQTILKGTPNAPIVFPITVVNDGNGETVYTIDVSGSRGEWSMTFSPPQLTVPPSQTAGQDNRGTVTTSVLSDQSTQYSNDLGTYTLEAAASPKNNPPGRSYEIPPVSLSAIVHVQGVYVPGLEVPAALGALAAASVLIQRSRKPGSGKD